VQTTPKKQASAIFVSIAGFNNYHLDSSIYPPAALTKATLKVRTMATTVGLSRGGQAFFGSLCAGTFGLGVWQTQRYYEKIEMMENRNKQLLAPVIDVNDQLQQISDTHNTAISAVTANREARMTWAPYQRYRLRGRLDHSHAVLVGPRGPPPGALYHPSGSTAPQGTGYMLLTPLIIETEPVKKDEPQSVRQTSSWWWRRSLPSSTSTKQAEKEVDAQTDTANASPSVVWVNRGWVPRHLVMGGPVRRGTASRNVAPKVVNKTWDEPKGWVDIVVVPGAFEGEFVTARGVVADTEDDAKEAGAVQTHVGIPKWFPYIVQYHHNVSRCALLYNICCC
jgi:cytochrome oxidase assembly protein ShyY1